MRVYCGLASAGQRIPVAIVDDAGRLLASDEVDDTPAGYAAVCTLIAERCTETGPLRAAMATDSETNLVPLLLAASGEPLAVGDAGTIAQFASDEPPGTSEPQSRAVALARALQAGTLAATTQPAPRDLTALRPVLTAHRAAAVGRSAALAMLRDLLRELYPAALRAFADPGAPLALAILERLGDPAQLSHGPDADVVGQLRAAGMPDAEEAIARLRSAAAGMSLRRSSSEAVGPAVRSGVAAVRSADDVAAALLRVIAEHLEPRTGGRGFPAPRASSPAAGGMPVSGPPSSSPPVFGPPVPSPLVSGPPAPSFPVSGPPAPSFPVSGPPMPEPMPAQPVTGAPVQAPQPAGQAPTPPPPMGPVSASPPLTSQPFAAPQLPTPPPQQQDPAPMAPPPAPPSPAPSPPPAMLPPTRQPSGQYQQQPSSGSPYSTPPATNSFPTTPPSTPGAWGGHTGSHRQPPAEAAASPYGETGRPQPPTPPIPHHAGSAVPDQSDEELSLLTPDELPTNPNLRRPAEPEPHSAEQPSDRLGALIEFPRLARRTPPEPASSPRHGQQQRRDTEDEPTQEYRPPSPRRQTPVEEAPSSAPPLSDSDGDLLIFAQARSVWFTGDGESAGRTDWRTEADVGWTAAEAASRPTVGGTTTSGLPRRVPSANLVPGTAPNRERSQVLPVSRDAAQLAAHTAGYFRGWNQARQDVQEPPEYPSVRHQ